jgi:hypothetical protein
LPGPNPVVLTVGIAIGIREAPKLLKHVGLPTADVVGVAKSAFRSATHAIPVLRGASARPLYVMAAGMPRTDAAGLVRHMAGQHRLPKRPASRR